MSKVDIVKSIFGFYEIEAHHKIMLDACDSALARNKQISKHIRQPCHDEEKKYWTNARAALVWSLRLAEQRYKRLLDGRHSAVQ
jgi:hypothetical protein